MTIKPRTSTTRVVLYARYSSDNQRDASIEDQIRVCQTRVQREGWQVTACYTDHAISGSTQLRSGYQALLSTMRAGGCDVVLAESLDRLSRDQEHVAQLYKAAQFAGVRLITLSEGEISELHIGVKGTMGALYLKDLADKTRRGLEGRVRQGRSGGGLCYGYRVIRGPFDRQGNSERGLRVIDPEQAPIVQRIFAEFAAGDSPIAIAKRLNAEGVTGPTGRAWSDGALRGHARACTGILRNELYAGQLIWNRRRWIKDPETGRRVSRLNAPDKLVRRQVPELRIIEERLWEETQRRLQEAARPHRVMADGSVQMTDHVWQHRRAQTLLSGKVFCAACGGSYVTSGQDYMACKAMVRQGQCQNRRRVRRSRLEGQVMEALQHGLMQPELVAVFVEGFTAEWNRLASGAAVERERLQRELLETRRKLDRLIEAIENGMQAPRLQDRLDGLSARETELGRRLAAFEMQAGVPRLHPALAQQYRKRVERLLTSLVEESGREVLDAARALIARVEVGPETGTSGGVELVGELSALLGLASGDGLRWPLNAKSPSLVGDGLLGTVCSSSVDAGTGFEPVTFRL